MKGNLCWKCRNCVVASYQFQVQESEGYDVIECKPNKIKDVVYWRDTYACIFGVKDCPNISKCSHFKSKLKPTKSRSHN